MRLPIPPVRWSAVRAGSGLALAVAVPAVLIASVASGPLGLERRSNWVFAFYALVLAGLVAGARRAARRGPRYSPLVHGVLAALGAFAVIAGAGTLIRLAAQRDLDGLALLFNLLVAGAAGIAGGLLASVAPPARRRHLPGPESGAPGEGEAA